MYLEKCWKCDHEYEINIDDYVESFDGINPANWGKYGCASGGPAYRLWKCPTCENYHECTIPSYVSQYKRRGYPFDPADCCIQ